jgi:hypothetical protein
MSQGKPTVLASGALRYALESLSKNQLIDLIVDRVGAEIGEEASDLDVANKIQEWLTPVFALRNDRAVSLPTKMRKWDLHAEKYRNKDILTRCTPRLGSSFHPED